MPDQVRDPLPRERPQLLISDDFDVAEIRDPLQLMLDCERLDEVAGCARGTHYDEICCRYREKLSR